MKRLLGVTIALLVSVGLSWGDTCAGATGGFPDVDLTTAGSSGFINGALFQQIDPRSTGSGVIDPFVRISTNDDCEHGYNTDARPLEFDENSSPTFTHDLLLADVPIKNIGGTNYFEFLLDINQTNTGGTDHFLSLDKIQIFQSNTAGATGYPGSLGTMVYDLDLGGDNWIKLDYGLNTGSGSGDMFAYIPVSLFDLAKTNIYFYSRFGEDFENNDGFEEWAIVGPGGGTFEIPEPSTYLLMGPALFALGFWRRRARV